MEGVEQEGKAGRRVYTAVYIGVFLFLLVGLSLLLGFLYYTISARGGDMGDGTVENGFEWDSGEKVDLSEVSDIETTIPSSSQGNSPALPVVASSVLYDEKIQIGWGNWSHGIVIDESVRGISTEGNALKIVFNEEYAQFRLHTASFDTARFNSIILNVRGNTDVLNKLRITLRDQFDVEVPYQPVAWYSPVPVEDSATWYQIRIPLKNLGGLAMVSDVILQSAIVGEMYIDSLLFSPLVLEYPLWKPAEGESTREWYEIPWDTLNSIDSQSLLRPLYWHEVYGSDLAIDTTKNRTVFRLKEDASASLAVYTKGRDFEDYTFAVVVDWENINTVGLGARVKDAQNFVHCSFYSYGSGVGLYEVKEGEDIFIRSGSSVIPSFEAWNNVSLAIRVNGNSIECMKDGVVVVRGESSTMPQTGSVAFKLWNKDPKNEGVVIESISVTPDSSQ